MNEPKTYYHRHLPHYQPEGEKYHVVFRLAGSLPRSVLQEWRVQIEGAKKRIKRTVDPKERSKIMRESRRMHFERFEKLLAEPCDQPLWLRKPRIAKIVEAAIRFWDQKKIDLIAFTIMPNHVHMAFGLLPQGINDQQDRRDRVPSDTPHVRRVSDPTPETPIFRNSFRVTEILASIKKYSALRANKALGRKGAFWHDESYDHVIRNSAELDRTIAYILMNPVKAGLCSDWREWKWSYVKSGHIGD